MMETFSPLSGGAFVYFAQKYAKTFPWYRMFVEAFPGADKWAHRFMAGALSLGVGMGISLVFEGDWSAGWKFSGTIPPGWTLLEGLWHSLEVFAMQAFAYETASVRTDTTNIRTGTVNATVQIRQDGP